MNLFILRVYRFNEMKMESTTLVFLVGICVGAIFALLLHQAEVRTIRSVDQQNNFYRNLEVVPKYREFFDLTGYEKKIISEDEISFSGRFSGLSSIEANWLYDKVKILCVVLVTKLDYAASINDTWIGHCNDKLFYSSNMSFKGITIDIEIVYANSSWQLLCNAMTIIRERYPETHWSIFISNNMFVIPENLRYLIATLDHNLLYYLGHPVVVRGVKYNIASAGFVLSKGAIEKIVKVFPNVSVCSTGGRFWNREDFYLGKHLTSLGVKLMDTRDENKMATFMGYDIDSMMNPGSQPKFAQYYTNSLQPVKCCSHRAVTFQVPTVTSMYTVHYTLYKVKVFSTGHLGNRPAPLPEKNEDYVWQGFLKGIGKPFNVSSGEYRRLWVKQVADDLKNSAAIMKSSQGDVQNMVNMYTAIRNIPSSA